MFAPDFGMRINFKPLAPVAVLERYKPDRVLKRMRRVLMKELKSRIQQSAFSAAAKRRLFNGYEVIVGPNSITVRAKDPAFLPLIRGQQPGQMRWLTKARAPIPIVTESGELIFRSATPRSMANGSWYHPGRRPTTILEKARAATREIMKEHIRKEMAGMLRQAMR